MFAFARLSSSDIVRSISCFVVFVVVAAYVFRVFWGVSLVVFLIGLFFESALRVHPAVTRLMVYRRP